MAGPAEQGTDLRLVARARALAALAALATLGPAAAAPTASTDAAAILEHAERVRSPDLDFAVEFAIDVTDPTTVWKERHQSYTMVAHGKDLSLILLREPASFYPGTLLISAGQYWLLLPRSSKPLQLSSRHVLAGDIANGDLARGNLVAFYQPRWLGEAAQGGRPCHQLELLRKHDLGLYSRIVAWIDRESFRPLQLEYFGQTGEALKTARYGDYRDGPLGVRSMRIDVETPSRPTEHTTLVFSNLRPIDASGLTFTTEGLPAFRDTARRLADQLGRQPRIEEIIGDRSISQKK